SSNNKYLEIYNGTGAAVDLSAYSISTCSNGCNDTTSAGLYTWDYPNNITFAAGTVIADGDVYVIHHGSASSDIVAQGDQTFTYLSNGDDVMALTVAGATDSVFTIIDIIGEMGPDPGSGWDVAGVTNGTKDHTLVRKSSIRSGNTSWSSSAGTNATDSEWMVEAKDTWTYVGSHTMLNLNQYFIKVTGSSNTTAGAYLLTVAEKPFNVNYGNLVINEIHYNPATSQGNDSEYEFLELYNISSADINLMGMTVGQAGSTSSIASLDSVTIGAGSYVVVAYTGATYSSLTVPVVNKGGYFGLSNSGKALELIDSTGAIVDFVTYDDYTPWSTLPDGGGPSLELIDATKDNSVASNWRGYGKFGGTPGVANSAQPDISMG
ncbi:uncharacterized protein METZ01_LOCUS305598, partial [marine metagenome]